MIRINLLREPSRKKAPRLAPSQSKWLIGFLVVLVVEAVLLGGWYYRLDAGIIAQQEEISDLQAEQARLKTLQEELQRFRQEKAELERRLRVVEQLQANQQGPVNLMNAVVRSLPEAPNLWLTSLTQRGSILTIEGRAFAVPPIAEFIASLTNRRPIRDVELDFWERDEQVVKFKITCALDNQPVENP